MEFSKELLVQYQKFLRETNIRECYQEVINMIKALRASLANEMPEFIFTGKIVENQMDFSYFQATTQELKGQGLKIQVVFIHKLCRLEVWVSGYNRNIQCLYHEKLRSLKCPYEMCENPEKMDYIVRVPVQKSIGEDDYGTILNEIKEHIKEYELFFRE